jgi:hypothetical protein
MTWCGIDPQFACHDASIYWRFAMPPFLVDGGGYSRSVTPSKAPSNSSPPPPQRVADAPIRTPRGASADAVERHMQTQKQKLGDAATNSQQKVAAAVRAEQTVATYEKLPPKQRSALRDEIEDARSQAGQARREADHAIQSELDIARESLSPAHFENYVHAMDRDFEANRDEQEFVRGSLARDNSTAKGAAADRTDREVEEARDADQDVKDIANSTALTGQTKQLALREARDAASQEWREANTAIHDELALIRENAPPTNLSQYGVPDPFAAKRNEIVDRLGGGSDLVKRVDAQFSRVQIEAQTKIAVTEIQNAARDGGVAEAARVFTTYTQYASPALKASIESATNHIVDSKAVSAAAEVDKAYQRGGAVEAARVLDEQTANLTAAQNVQTLQIADATVGKIAADLGERLQRDDEPLSIQKERKVYDPFDYNKTEKYYVEDSSNQAEFDAIVGHLSATVERASNDPAKGAAVTDAVADKLTNAMGNKIGRIDESFETSVVNGNGARLGLAVVANLKGDKRGDDILQNIVAGAKTLEGQIEKSTKALVKNNEYYFHVSGELGELAVTDTARQEALEKFKNRQGGAFDSEAFARDYAKLQKQQDALGTTLVDLSVARASGVISDDMGHADDTDKLLKTYANDPAKQQAVLSGEKVQQKVAALLDQAAAGDKGATSFLDQLNETGGNLGSARTLFKGAAEITLANVSLHAMDLASQGDRKGAIKLLREFEDYPFLGISKETLSKGIKAVENYKVPSNATTAEVKAANAKLFSELQLAGFSDQSPASRLFAGVGLGINVLSLGGAAAKIKAGDPDGWARMIVGVGDAAIAGNELAKSYNAGVEKFYEAHPGLSGGVKVLSVSTSVASTVFGWVDFANTLPSGDKVDIALSGIGALGGTLATGAQILGPSGVGALSGPAAATLSSWATGIGIFVTIGVLGKSAYDTYKDLRKFNGEPSQQFLIDLNYSPEAAKILAKQDINGRGPNEGGHTAVPALAAAADLLIEQGVIKDMSEFQGVVNKLAETKDGRNQLEHLVESAYTVPRGDSGEFRKSAGKADEAMRDNDPEFWNDFNNAGDDDYIGSRFPRSVRGLALLMGNMGLVDLPSNFYDEAGKP